jgi:hypothetical protein
MKSTKRMNRRDFLQVTMLGGLASLLPLKGITYMRKVEKNIFGKLDDSTPIYLFTLKNDHGIEMKITNFGAIVVSLIVPDKNG